MWTGSVVTDVWVKFMKFYSLMFIYFLSEVEMHVLLCLLSGWCQGFFFFFRIRIERCELDVDVERLFFHNGLGTLLFMLMTLLQNN